VKRKSTFVLQHFFVQSLILSEHNSKFFMNRKIRGYKEKGWISNFKVKAQIREKYHNYFLEKVYLRN